MSEKEKEDRKFQIEVLKIQLRHETTTALYLGAIALGYSLMVALLPLLWSIEIADIQKLVIYVAMIFTAILLVYFLFQYKKEVKRLDANIRKLESEYIKTEKKKKGIVEHSENIKK